MLLGNGVPCPPSPSFPSLARKLRFGIWHQALMERNNFPKDSPMHWWRFDRFNYLLSNCVQPFLLTLPFISIGKRGILLHGNRLR